jgi:hypothetical protein
VPSPSQHPIVSLALWQACNFNLRARLRLSLLWLRRVYREGRLPLVVWDGLRGTEVRQLRHILICPLCLQLAFKSSKLKAGLVRTLDTDFRYRPQEGLLDIYLDHYLHHLAECGALPHLVPMTGVLLCLVAVAEGLKTPSTAHADILAEQAALVSPEVLRVAERRGHVTVTYGTHPTPQRPAGECTP